MKRASLMFAFLLGSASAATAAAPHSLGTYRNTDYYVCEEANFPTDPRDTPVLDLQGNTLAMVNAQFKKAFDIEGTAKLNDNRVLNFAGRVNGSIRYHWTDAPYGNGVGTCRLEPFRTIAVDPKRVPLGSTVRIPATVGMPLPGGKKHDGVWVATDIGSAIQKDRVDIFVGVKEDEHLLEDYKITNLKALEIILIKLPGRDSCVFSDPKIEQRK